MSKYLEEKCMNLGIRLVYTYNKSTVLCAEIHKEKPLLIADMLFKNCPDSISQAIIGFFTDMKYKNSHEKVIRSFVEEYFKPYRPGNIKHLDLSYLVISSEDKGISCKVEPEKTDNNNLKEINVTINPKVSKQKINTVENDSDSKNKRTNHNVNFHRNNIDINKIDVNSSNLIELDVQHISSKDLWGDEKQYSPNTFIKPLEDSELKLNIVVLPPGT